MTDLKDIAWLAGIIDGEGCFSVKRPIRRLSGERAGFQTTYQVWVVLCNTSKAMVERAVAILDGLGVKHQPVRRVWKGKRATRWQYWLHVARKDEVLRLTEALLPHLTAKRCEAEMVSWYLKRACQKPCYKTTVLDRVVLDAMADVKRNGGEAPAEVRELLREVIPSQADVGHRAIGETSEGVETRSVTPKDNPTQERPAPSVFH